MGRFGSGLSPDPVGSPRSLGAVGGSPTRAPFPQCRSLPPHTFLRTQSPPNHRSRVHYCQPSPPTGILCSKPTPRWPFHWVPPLPPPLQLNMIDPPRTPWAPGISYKLENMIVVARMSYVVSVIVIATTRFRSVASAKPDSGKVDQSVKSWPNG